MKKIYTVLVIAFFLMFPACIEAKEGINNYYIDLTVLENGDVSVKELFTLTGKYNGYERTINFKNKDTSLFDGSLESFNGSSIYNGDNIILKEIRAVEIDESIGFKNINKQGTIFNEASFLENGDFGKFERIKTNTGEKYKIYNPSDSKEKGFYIEYIITNIAVIHNDIAEIGLNLFNQEQVEDIENLEMYINIPNNKNELRAWGHGILTGETTNINMEKLKLTISDLPKQTATDVRFVFDKEVVKNSNKYSNTDGLNSILTVETKKAEEANLIREEARNREKKDEMIGIGIIIFNTFWIMGLVIIFIYIYTKYDKEYKSKFSNNYYRDFPANYGPEIVGYLMDKKIENKDLSASIMLLIYKKNISFEEIEKKDFKLIKNNEKNITKSEKELMKFLFDDVNEITLSGLKKIAKTNSEKFIERYNYWKTETINESKKYNFFENFSYQRVLAILYCIMGLLIAFITITYPNVLILNIAVIIASFIFIIYFSTFTKRTILGNEDYHKWIGLKNFLNDFGNFKEKELPEIILWEKYLVYAVTLGCSKKLAKSMEIKVKELNPTYNTGDMIFDIYYMNMLINFNKTIDTTIASTVSLAQATIAESANSSAGGFGGGFSGGGGSFGGGGGGGRF